MRGCYFAGLIPCLSSKRKKNKNLAAHIGFRKEPLHEKHNDCMCLCMCAREGEQGERRRVYILHVSLVRVQSSVSRVQPELTSTMKLFVCARRQAEASWSTLCYHSGCVTGSGFPPRGPPVSCQISRLLWPFQLH